MAFKATALVVEQAFDRIRAQAFASKQYLTSQRGLMTQPTCLSNVVLGVIQHLGNASTIMGNLAATPGLATYAKSQVDDPNYDIQAEFIAMRDAMTSARDSLIASFPKDGNGWLLHQKLEPAGTVTERTFTAAQLASAVLLIDGVIASID